MRWERRGRSRGASRWTPTPAPRNGTRIVLLAAALLLLAAGSATAAPPHDVGPGKPEHVREPPAHAATHAGGQAAAPGERADRSPVPAPAPERAPEATPEPTPLPDGSASAPAAQPSPEPEREPVPGPGEPEPTPVPAPAPSPSPTPHTQDPATSGPTGTPAPTETPSVPPTPPDEIEFAYWIEGRLVFVLAFHVAADDDTAATYEWDWGDGTRSYADAFMSHSYHADGDRFLIQLTRLDANGALTHTNMRWVDLDPGRGEDLDPHAADRAYEPGAAARTPDATTRSTHADRIVLGPGAEDPEVVYEVPAPPLPLLVLILVTVERLRRRR